MVSCSMKLAPFVKNQDNNNTSNTVCQFIRPVDWYSIAPGHSIAHGVAKSQAEDLILRHILIIGKAHNTHTTLGEGIIDHQHKKDHIEDKIPNHQRRDPAIAIADAFPSCR